MLRFGCRWREERENVFEFAVKRVPLALEKEAIVIVIVARNPKLEREDYSSVVVHFRGEPSEGVGVTREASARHIVHVGDVGARVG